jgi:hypothetical protein
MSWKVATGLSVAVLGALALFSGSARAQSTPAKPRSYDELEEAYGRLQPGLDYAEGDKGRIVLDPSWKAEHIVNVSLATGQTVAINKAIADEFVGLWDEAYARTGWSPAIVQTWVPRHINWDSSRHLSLHSWGIAFDVDPGANPRGKSGGEIAMHPDWAQVWIDAGWVWGGNWHGEDRDEMHFEAAQLN